VQKFGLDALLHGKPSPLELEIAKERAGALGRTGRRLQKSLDVYAKELGSRARPEKIERMVEEIAAIVFEFLTQRETMGLVHENLEWVLKTYDLPDAVLAKLGVKR
jgi:DNA topoisomerase VI subunit B